MSHNSSFLSPPEPITVNQAVEFLHQDNSNEISNWKRSAQSIALNTHQRQITFTTNVFIPLTFLCRNACHYCGFRRSKVPIGQEFLNSQKVEKILTTVRDRKVSEVLITMGDKPEKKYPLAEKWLKKHGFDSTIEYSYFIAEKALKYELLPHINGGTLTFDELRYLREVSASIGMMLETISSRLTHSGLPHEQSPDKHPKNRIATINNAGRLKIPFTSGILIGIGETLEEIVESLFALKNVHQKYRHLQEVIIQNFQPNPDSVMANSPPPSIELMEKILIIARHILPAEISIQIPPNLVESHEHRFIEAGMSDWGGISSITLDYINPDHRWPSITKLEQITQKAGYQLCERLPVYPRYINLEWLSPQVYKLASVKRLDSRTVK
ncbi:MAG: 7,8-didemethyl-8-hydroxy-5-deazariboflavin synthase subunit CofG [Candidatus Heimdallarchaeota archaeon]|nr:MAG: 7,8-didemethyl-8-hydroxy-5-deazariboflavin synthase subunit CofG [Candidatus Heimdallarchaeota archaeon]